MRGLYSANGSVIKEHRVAFKTTCKALANDLLYVLNRDFGIDGYITTNKAKRRLSLMATMYARRAMM